MGFFVYITKCTGNTLVIFPRFFVSGMMGRFLYMKIESYQQKHFESCMEIIQSNTPKYILPFEHLDYKNYLSRKSKTYFVFFKDNDLVACGGYGLNKTKTKAGLSWGLVHRRYHNQGFGSQSIKYRLNHIMINYPEIEIHLDTSQHTHQFFEKFGFITEQITKNGYGEGLDKYDMTLNKDSNL